MKYIFGQSQTVLANIDLTDEVLMVPVSKVLAIEKLSTTTLKIHTQATDNTGDAGFFTLKHADTTAAATLDVSRKLIDDAVAMINNDLRSGVGVLFDGVNNVRLTHGLTTSNVVDEA